MYTLNRKEVKCVEQINFELKQNRNVIQKLSNSSRDFNNVEGIFSRKSLLKLDPQKIIETYDKWPEIGQQSYEDSADILDIKNFSNITFAGMGGSNSINTVISSILSKNKIPSFNLNGFDFPNHLDSDSIFIATSVSGNTLETLTALDSARKADCQIIAFSEGGKIEEYCKKHGLEHRKVSKFHSPRASFTSFLYSMLRILQPILSISEKEILESLNQLSVTKQKIYSKNITDTNPSMDLASWFPKTPVIYYSKLLEASAVRFRNSFNENAKSHAITNELTEACHNEIVCWELPTTSKPMLVRTNNDHKRTAETWNILKEFFEEKEIEYKEIFSNNGNILSQLVGLIYLFDYSTIYYAIKCGINPSPIISTEYFKNKRKTSF